MIKIRTLLLTIYSICMTSSSALQTVSRGVNLCSSKIYCQGDLLYTIQMSGLFADSKTFVDMPTKFSEPQVLSNFAKLTNRFNLTELGQFIDTNFHPSGYDVVKVEPADWTESPAYLSKILDQDLNRFARFLNLKWKHLVRKFDSKAKLCEACTTSAIPTSFPFVVPGGRFIEYYYWDTFWILEGLLISEMTETARGVLINFLEIIKRDGFVPNGARAYYLNRSQPPLLTQMIDVYLKHTNDLNFLNSSLEVLDAEYQFWLREKLVNYSRPNDLSSYSLFVYNVESNWPRPESYKEDYENAQKSEGAEADYYSNVMTAAESGWDFSSRWFENAMDIKTIQIRDMAPVDLNAIVYKNAKILSKFHKLVGDEEKRKFYESEMNEREQTVNKIFWDERKSRWADLNRIKKRLHIDFEYVSDLSPLWNGIRCPVEVNAVLADYNSILMNLASGIPASSVNTKQQWDFPNAWAPYHQWIVEYLVETNRTDMALDIAQRFVSSVYCGWKKYENIYEKYNAEKRGERGQGGEYIVQEGFGWTNGVCMSLMNFFGDRLVAPQDCDQKNSAFRKVELNTMLLVLMYAFTFILKCLSSEF